MPLRTNFRPGNTFRGVNLRAPQVSPRPGTVAESAEHQTMAGGSLLIKPGLGQSYGSLDEYAHLTSLPISGGGLGAGLSEISKKLQALKSQPLRRKPKNIRFTL